MTQHELITLERLRELVFYDADAGLFTWLRSTNNRVKIGDVAGSANGDGYLRIWLDGHRYYAQRLAWFYVTGEWPKDQVDHVDGSRGNNRWANLRQASRAENQQNRAVSKPSLSGILGVSWHVGNRKWRADIQVNGQHKHLGYFATRESAQEAYLKAKAEFHEFQPIPRAG